MIKLPPALDPLKQTNNWVLWNLTDGKKLPYRANKPTKKAQTNDPTTWASYDVARKAAKKPYGIGFVLRGCGIGAIDIDDCRDPKTGRIEKWAREILDAAPGAYVEVTPSGGGLRIIGRASGAEVHTSRRRGNGKYELYRNATRYITITGNEIGQCDDGLANIDKLIDKLKQEPEVATKDRSRSGVLYGELVKLIKRGMSDDDIFQRLKPKGLHGQKGDDWLRSDIKRTRAKSQPADDAERALSEYREEKIDWLWYPYFPRDMVTCLEGEGEMGKSRLSRFIAAAITKGRPLPGVEVPLPPGNVVIASFSEDPVPSVVVPQIRKMGGDLDKVFVIEKPFALDDDGIGLLRGVIERRRPVALIMDPLSDYIPSKANSYKDEEVRRFVMGPLQALAKEFECAIIAIRHFRKSSDGSSKYRGGGSVAFTNVSRATVACVQDPDNPDIVIMGVNKGNLVPKSKKVSLLFEIVETLDDIGSLEWRGETHSSFDDIEDQRRHMQRNPEQELAATEFLTQQLPKGEWVLVSKLKERAEVASCSWSTIEKVKRKLNVQRRGAYPGTPAKWRIE